MNWWQLSVHSSLESLAYTEDSLLDLGAVCITLGDAEDKPIYEPLPGNTPVWQQSIVTGLFEPRHNLESLYDGLVKRLPASQVASVRQSVVEDQDWVEAYKQHFKPIQCADQLWIVPDWLDPPDPQAINIRLDPGLAFGTGNHPTTFLCLAWMGKNKLDDETVIDYGCGSGILAIAACKLGAKSVVAVDIDPQAIASSAKNARRNKIDDTTISLLLPHEMAEQAVDLLIANILSGPLVDFAARFSHLVKSRGRILLSGILASQLDDILNAYNPFFDFDPIVAKEDWILVSGTRKDV